MSAQLEAIWRYPVKSLAGQPLMHANLAPDFGLEGDRQFAIFNSAAEFDPLAPAHLDKNHFLNLMKHEKLAEYRAEIADDGALQLFHQDAQIYTGHADDPGDMRRAQALIAAHFGDLGKFAPILLSARQHSFSDIAENCLSLINLASVEALQQNAGIAVDPARFRGNLYLRGLPAFAERDWPQAMIVQIGSARLRILRPITRCAAINVNPHTARRDTNLPRILLKQFDGNIMGVYAAVERGGAISCGDEVEADGS